MAEKKKDSAPPSTGMMKVLKLVPALIIAPEVQQNGIMAPADGWEGKGTRRVASGINPMAKFERPGSTVVGVYRATREKVGVNESRVYDFADPETGELFGVWGSTILDQRMAAALPRPGDFVRIVYLGDVETGRGQSDAHNFEVAVRPEALGLPAAK
jgi:hypothetical protein